MISSKPSAAALGLLLLVPYARATYSIVATESDKRQIGGAGLSCVPNANFANIVATFVPDRGILHTQAFALSKGSPSTLAAKAALEGGETTPAEILDTMIELDNALTTITEGGPLVPFATLRQNLIADFDSTAGFTGPNIEVVITNAFNQSLEQTDAGLEQGPYKAHAGANICLEGTVQAVLDGFSEDTTDFGSCDLPGRLMNSMYNVLAQNLGDYRCVVDFNTTAAVGYIRVMNPDGSIVVDINQVGNGRREPLEIMKRKFLAWRRRNPCPNDASGAPTDAPVAPTLSPSSRPSASDAPTEAPAEPIKKRCKDNSRNVFTLPSIGRVKERPNKTCRWFRRVYRNRVIKKKLCRRKVLITKGQKKNKLVNLNLVCKRACLELNVGSKQLDCV